MKTYKVEIHPNNIQQTLLSKACGVARFTYNWGLQYKKTLWKTNKQSISAIGLHKELNKLKKTKFPWMYEVSKCAPQEALRNLDKAYDRWFKYIKQRKNNKNIRKVGFPKLHKKGKHDSFTISTGSIKITNNNIQLPRIGKIKFKEQCYLPTDKHILFVTVSRQANHWFVSVTTNEERIIPQKNNSDEIVGVDLGIKTLIVASNGTKIENPKALKNKEKQLKRAHKKLSKSKKGSRNRIKCRKRLATIYYKISCLRKDVINKATTTLVKTKPKAIVVENLNVSGMMKNRKLSKHIQDCSFGEIRRQLDYKCKWNNIEYIMADRYYPSSKRCSVCGFVNDELTLKDREWVCPQCGQHHDRDINASYNLRDYYFIVESTVSSTGSQVCGDVSSGIVSSANDVNLVLVKQKKNNDIAYNIV